MLKAANETISIVDAYIKKHFNLLSRDFLSPKDWEYFRKVKLVLLPFYKAILDTQGDNTTIDRVLFTMDILIQYLDNSLNKYSTYKEFATRIRNI